MPPRRRGPDPPGGGVALAMENLPLSLKPVTSSVDVAAHIDEGRMVTLVFPRRVLRRVVGAAARLRDFQLHQTARHTNDVMFAAFVLKAFQMPGFVERFVHRAFVDDADPHVIAFHVLIKNGGDTPLTVLAFATEARRMLAEHALVLNRQPDEEEEEETPAAQGQARAKRRRVVQVAPPIVAAAYVLVSRPIIPVHRIAMEPPFSVSPLAWATLLASEADLKRAMVHAFAARLAELGEEVSAAGPSGGPFVRAGAASAMDTAGLESDDTDSEGGDENNDGNGVVRFALADGSHVLLKTELEEFLKPNHELTRRFVRPVILTDKAIPAGASLLWELAAPLVDLPHLSSRYLAHSDLYDAFSSFSDEVNQRKDALEVNPMGDMALLSAFFAEHGGARDGDRESAARLAFDTMTRTNGRLPKAVAEMMGAFVDALKKSDGYLPAGTGREVVQYRNLSYAGNYALHVLGMFEQMGTFHFHVEQFVTMLVLDGVHYRPRHEDDDDDQTNVGMCANLLNYGA